MVHLHGSELPGSPPGSLFWREVTRFSDSVTLVRISLFTLSCYRPFLLSQLLSPIRWSSAVAICAPSPQFNMKRSPSAYLNDENLRRSRRSRRHQLRTPGTGDSALRTSAPSTSAASELNQSWSPPPHPLPDAARSAAPRTPPRTSALRSPRPHSADEAGRTPFGPWPRMGVHPSELLKEFSASGQPSRNILEALAMRPVFFLGGPSAWFTPGRPQRARCPHCPSSIQGSSSSCRP